MPDEAKLNNSKSKNMERVYSRGPSFKKLENMDYLEILDSYIEYPSKNLKFTVTNSNGERDKVKFINEEEKAYGWRQNHSSCRKTSKFLQTNLHYLPEHLWKSKKSFVDKTVNSTVGYKVKDNNINYFVHKADSDSITEETLEYLAELAKTNEIWLEFGIQSVYDETLLRINRGHDSANVKEWIIKSKKAGVNVCGHLIFGLGGETQEMMLETSRAAYEWGIDSVKYHPLYVVKKTALANEFNRGEFTPISEELYLDTLLKSVQMKPENVSVQRVTAGIDDDSLLSPKWCRDKNKQIKNINAAFKKIGLKY